jgi:hypothetical protein
MLDSYFYPSLQKKRMAKKIIFQQDGASAHFSKAVCSWLDEKFFLWGLIKRNIYKTKVQDIDELKTRIIEEIEAIKTETLRNVFMETSKRMNFCISIKGDTFEQYF